MTEQNKPAIESSSPPEPDRPSSQTPLYKRVLAWIGVIIMVLLVLVYTYSVATGKILEW